MLFGRLVPLLFASPHGTLLKSYTLSSSSCTSIATKFNHCRAISSSRGLSSTIQDTSETAEDITTPRKIINDVKALYRDLSQGCYIHEYSDHPTIQFKYTSPVEERSNFKEVLNQIPPTDGKLIFDTIASNYGSNKPVLLYLPGLDGVGISGTSQFDDLSNAFEFWRMSVDQVHDRSSFTDLTTAVSNFIQDIAMKQKRKVILVGESFGGLLAPSVALRVQARAASRSIENPIQGLVMINPATSFDQTQWSTLAPILASLRHIEQEEQQGPTPMFPTPYSVLGGIALSLVVPDSTQFRNIFDIFTNTKVSTAEELQDVIRAMRDGFGLLADNLPAEVIEHRVGRWLPVGCEVVNSRLDQIDVPALVIAGEDDNMLPTKNEGARLVKAMKNCTSMFVKGSGHFVLDDRFNLTEAIIDAPFDPFQQKKETTYDPIMDWKLPSDEELQEAIENRVKPLRILTSPKFFSTGVDGKRVSGLGKVPNNVDGPLLFVANHQLLGLDLGMIIAELLEQREIAARGLAHPIIFQGPSGNGFGGPGPTGPSRRITKRNRDGVVDPPMGDFQTFGAVMVTPRNYYRLMQTGQTALLFPGGVREVFHGKGEAYELFWPEKVDFVRVASKFNATIVPISAVGAADSVNILADAPDILNLPFGLGERALNNTQNVIAARYDQDNADELFQPPLVVPKLTPARHYFTFGKPFDTTELDHSNKEACAKLYKDVKAELRRGLDDLLVAREKDPFNNFFQRIATEQILKKQAPTFPVEELNK
mmetsp:Transcript_13166/g.24742  ORF Transcript_13166/g.24742 Transcript_13166/m.24742 type:complete len:764 (+) Transcript_13166:1190-3481(+)